MDYQERAQAFADAYATLDTVKGHLRVAYALPEAAESYLEDAHRGMVAVTLIMARLKAGIAKEAA